VGAGEGGSVGDFRTDGKDGVEARGGSWTPDGGALRVRRGGSGGSRRLHDTQTA
jgi:hypothetical protein